MITKQFTPYKGREIKTGQRVYAYRNLHNGKYSIVDLESRLVLGHAHSLTITNAWFFVRESGRQRVLKEKRKNVHAYVIGNYAQDSADSRDREPVSYNPYKGGAFTKANGEPITRADSVSLTGGGAFYRMEEEAK